MNPPPIICEKCHKKEATVHLMQVVSHRKRGSASHPPSAASHSELTKRTDLCEECAIVAGLGGTPKEIFPDLSEPEYRALAFISACIELASARPNQVGRHVSARDLLTVAGEVALKNFGADARQELLKMGVVSSEALGNLIFSFIEKGVLSKTPDDRIEDFRIRSALDEFLETA